jgi:hypothetical protein
MKRAAFALEFLLLVQALGLAESGQHGWDNLKQLAPGQQIRIVLSDARSCTGQFQSLTDAGIVVRLAAGDQAFERQSVLRISTQGKSHRGRNALIGLAVGTGAGIIVGVASPELGQGKCSQGSCVNATSVSVAGAAGAAVGAGLGAAIPTHGWHDVYRAR